MAFLLKTFGEEIGVYDTHVAAIEGAKAYADKMDAGMRADGITLRCMPIWRHVRWTYDPATGGSHTSEVHAVRESAERFGHDPSAVRAIFDIVPL